MKQCPNCGGENPDTAVFCAHCGTTLTDTLSQQMETEGQTLEPISPEPMATEPSLPEETPIPAEPKKKKKGLIFLGCGLALAAVAVGVFLYFFLNTPRRKVDRAIDKTMNILEEQLDTLDNLEALMDLDETYGGKSSGYAKFDMSSYDMSMNMEVSAAINPEKELYDLTVSLKADDSYTDGEEIIDYQIFREKDTIQLACQRLWGDTVLQMTPEELETSGANSLSNYVGQISTANEVELFAENTVWDAYWDSLTPEKVGTKTVDGRDWTEYRLVSQPEQREALVESIVDILDLLKSQFLNAGLDEEMWQEVTDEFRNTLGELEDLTLYINEHGYMSGIGIQMDGSFYGVHLAGKDNPWQDVSLIVDGEEILSGSIGVKDGVFTAKLSIPTGQGISVVLSLTYNDSDGTYSLAMKMMGMTIMEFAGEIKMENDGVRMTMDLSLNEMMGVDVGMSMVLEGMPLTEDPQPLSDNPTIFAQLSPKEQEGLMEGLESFGVD